jgi:hypothetical protein
VTIILAIPENNKTFLTQRLKGNQPALKISNFKRLLVVHKMSSLNLAKERLIIFSDRVDWLGSAYYLK